MPLPPMCGRPGVNVKRQLRGYQTTQLCSWTLATTSTHLRLMPRCVRPKKIIPHYPTGHNSEAGPAFVPIGNFLPKTSHMYLITVYPHYNGLIGGNPVR